MAYITNFERLAMSCALASAMMIVRLNEADMSTTHKHMEKGML